MMAECWQKPGECYLLEGVAATENLVEEGQWFAAALQGLGYAH